MAKLFHARSLFDAGNRLLLSARNCLPGLPDAMKLNHAVALAWLLGISFSPLVAPAFAEPPAVEEVLGVLGMDNGQIAKLAQGQPVAYALSEDSADELAAGIAWHLGSFGQGSQHLRQENPDPLDDVSPWILTEHGGASSWHPSSCRKARLWDADPDEYNLSP
jgi:hypothetical protein